MIVTFDLFSALTDTRTGASQAFAAIAAERGWDLSGETVYDTWDGHNKALQREARPPTTFREVSRTALEAAYGDLGLDSSLAEPDLARLHRTIPDWPLWPDVADGLPLVARRHRVGVLSNVDDAVFARTRVAPLVADLSDDDAVLTSERLQAYKPSPEIYRRARERTGGELVHVATSARDVRGALEAGIDVIRLRRPGHRLDPEGPQPPREAAGLAELRALLGAG